MAGKGPSVVENWERVSLLGSGGFGTVTLWRNQVSDEYIALKQCRLQADNSKLRGRWECEVDIMKRLNHPNVIAGKDVPPPLDVSKEMLPLLAMEYCSGGDLRKMMCNMVFFTNDAQAIMMQYAEFGDVMIWVPHHTAWRPILKRIYSHIISQHHPFREKMLNKPEHCCGLPELQVRFLAHDISRAIEYLHSNRIIHRDLKPENVVLHQEDERIIYKLIDLGYAKELDQNSICSSFVGTLQYLAPELFASQRYSRTVDYWSFGTVVFECITGIRPFLPTLGPVKWHSEVSHKTNNDICAFLDPKGAVQFSEKLPFPNNLCRTLQAYFEQWLRQVLQWNPEKRGGGLTEKNRPVCFDLLDSILAIKIVHVLDVATNQLRTYPVLEEEKVKILQKKVSEESKIPVEEQELLLPSGIKPDPEKSAAQCWAKPGEDDFVFFFRSNLTENTKEAKPATLTLAVQNIFKEPKTLIPFLEQRRAWAEAVYFCQSEEKNFKNLILAQGAAMLSVLRLNTIFLKDKAQMIQYIGKLEAKLDFFMISLKHDIQKYTEQAGPGGITSPTMLKKWQEMGQRMASFSELSDQVKATDDQCCALQIKIVQLQKSPFRKSKQTDVLKALSKEAQSLYENLKKAPKEKRSEFSDHTQIVGIVRKCIVEKHKAMGELYTHLSKVSQCKQELNTLLPQIKACCHQILQGVEKLVVLQTKRQTDVWNLLKTALSGNGGNSPASVLKEEMVGDIGNLPADTFTSDLSSNVHQSLQIIEDHKQTRAELMDLFSFVTEDQEEVLNSSQLDWESLQGI